MTSAKATVDQTLAGDSANTTQLVSRRNTDSAYHEQTAAESAQITVGNNSTMPSMRDESTLNTVTRLGAQVIINNELSPKYNVECIM